MKRLPVLLVSLVLFCALLALGIASDRTTTKAAVMDSSLREPIKVTPLDLKSEESPKGQTSSENEIWVNQPVVQVENISGKTIIFLMVEIGFPGAASSDEQVRLAYGQVPGLEHASRPGEPLQPGAKVNLSVSQNVNGGDRSHLPKGAAQLPTGSRATARIGVVIFADETAWLDGMLHVHDRSNPLRWNFLGPAQVRAVPIPASHFKIVKAAYTAPSAARPIKESECGDYGSFETLYCPTCGIHINSVVLGPNPFGYWGVHTSTHICCDGTPLEWNKRIPCPE